LRNRTISPLSLNVTYTDFKIFYHLENHDLTRNIHLDKLEYLNLIPDSSNDFEMSKKTCSLNVRSKKLASKKFINMGNDYNNLVLVINHLTQRSTLLGASLLRVSPVV